MTPADAIASLAAWTTAKRDEAEKARDEARSVPDGEHLYTAREARADAYQAVIVECARRIGALDAAFVERVVAASLATATLEQLAAELHRRGAP